jgi:hypothetical protein
MANRASTPGSGASPIQIRAQALRRRQGSAQASPGTAFPLAADINALDGKNPARKGSWRQADVKRAVDAAKKAGLENYRVEIAADGTISIIVGDPAATAPPA